MRSAYLILLFTSAVCFSKPLTVSELLKESETVRSKLGATKSVENKQAEVKKLEILLESTMKAYEAQSPNEGTKEEDQVNKLFFSLEPVFELVKDKITKDSCEKADHRIRIEDRDMTKPEAAPLSMQAKEAIAVLKHFCTL